MTPTPLKMADFQTFVQKFNGQKRKAAQYLVDHPKEVGVLSLRQVAVRSRVSPATLVQLAKDCGYSSYNEMKSMFQLEHIGVSNYFSGGAEKLTTSEDADERINPGGILAQIVRHDVQGIEDVMSEMTENSIHLAAALISEAKIVNVIGMRACYGAAHYLSYLLQLLRGGVSQLGPGDSTLVDRAHELGVGDVLVAFGFYPYVHQTVETVMAADAAGAKIIAITDSAASPLAVKGAVLLRVGTASPWIFSSITPAIVVSQALAGQVLIRGGQATLARIKLREQLLSDMRIFL